MIYAVDSTHPPAPCVESGGRLSGGGKSNVSERQGCCLLCGGEDGRCRVGLYPSGGWGGVSGGSFVSPKSGGSNLPSDLFPPPLGRRFLRGTHTTILLHEHTLRLGDFAAPRGPHSHSLALATQSSTRVEAPSYGREEHRVGYDTIRYDTHTYSLGRPATGVVSMPTSFTPRRIRNSPRSPHWADHEFTAVQ